MSSREDWYKKSAIGRGGPGAAQVCDAKRDEEGVPATSHLLFQQNARQHDLVGEDTAVCTVLFFGSEYSEGSSLSRPDSMGEQQKGMLDLVQLVFSRPTHILREIKQSN